MPRQDKVKESPSKGDDGDNLLSWFELHQSLINSTADTLKDDITIVKKRKIDPHTSILKREKKPAVVLSKTILVGYRDAISKAVKDLQSLESQMSEELRDRFNQREDWLQTKPRSVTPSMDGSGSELSGPTNRKERSELRLSPILDDDQDMSNEPVDPSTSDPQKTEDLQIAPGKVGDQSDGSDPDVVPASDDDTIEDDKNSVVHDAAKEVSNDENHLDKPATSKEKRSTKSPTPTPCTSAGNRPITNGTPVKPHMSSYSDSDSHHSSRKAGSREVTPKKKDKETGAWNASGSEGEASTESVDIKSQQLDESKDSKSPGGDSSKSRTSPAKASGDEAESGEVPNVKSSPADLESVNDGEDIVAEMLSQSLLPDPDGDDDDEEVSSAEEVDSDEEKRKSKKSRRTGSNSSPGKIKKKQKTAMKKAEKDAMKEVLGSSSESEEESRKTRQPRNKKPKVEDRKSGVKLDPKDDPKLKEGAAVVEVERLAPSIQKMISKDGHVKLKHYQQILKRGGQAGDSSDSDADAVNDSDDSLENFKAELKKLQKSSILQTVRYKEKRRREHKNARRSQRAKQKNDQSRDSTGNDDSESDHDFKKSSRKDASDEDRSCSGSDLNQQSDDNQGRKTRSKAGAANQKKNGNKKKRYQAVDSSDSDKDNMKEVLGSDESGSETSKKSRKKAAKDSDSDFMGTNAKAEKRTRKRRRAKSDSSIASKGSSSNDSDSDSDFKAKKKKTKGKKQKGSSSDESKTKKKKRRRIIAKGSDSSKKSGSDNSDEKNSEDEEASPSQKGRKNIRKILSKKDLKLSTREAEKKEEERRKRLADKQNLFNGIHKAPETDKLERLILDVDPKTKEPCVEVDTSIVEKLKPHQAEGIKFMYNACFESVEMIKENKVPGGCILAHCMGLGKTLQTVGFLHTLLTNEVCGIKTALVICPLSTVNNWYNEIRQWTEDCTDVRIHKIFEAKNTIKDRRDYLRTWQNRGGIGLLHYDIFRRLVDPKGKAKMKESDRRMIKETLLDPGPDIVVCDEGHLLKNCKSMLSLAVNNIKTLRRIVLTGTPLQNNLTEYHTMMNFVKPSLLGSLQEFTNRFVNPIKNGQHADSTDNDVKTMKRRAHVLHRKLEGCVQRCDYLILAPYLPPKYEYIINIRLSERQEQLYKHYLEHVVDSDPLARRRHLLKYYAELVKVWSHPIALTMRKQKADDDEEETSEDDSIKDFVVDDTTSSDSETGKSVKSDQSGEKAVVMNDNKNESRRKTRAQAANDPLDPDNPNPDGPEQEFAGKWWNAIFKSKSEMYDVEISGKLVVLQEILKTCETIGDKILVFSQFLTSLDIIEEFLAEWDKEAEKRQKEENPIATFPFTDIGGNDGRWRRNVEYFRIDGQSKVSDRQRDCEKFNKKSYSKAKLFLISTRAGGLGINLFGANRVVIFDASWNPSQDMQSIFRVYRFGQDKPCYIYRLISRGTMEEKILRRQITKLSLSSRVVDEHQIERHFKFDDINEMYRYDEEDDKSDDEVMAVPKDRLLADLLISHKNLIRGYEEFDSLLENKTDEGLSNEEKEQAWEEYRRESERKLQTPQDSTSTKLREKYVLQYKATAQQIEVAVSTAMLVIRKIQDWAQLQTQLNHAGLPIDLSHYIDPLKNWLQVEIGTVTLDTVQIPVPPEKQLTRPLPSIFHVQARMQSLPVNIQVHYSQVMTQRAQAYNQMYPMSYATAQR